jgi:hypothetical protein
MKRTMPADVEGVSESLANLLVTMTDADRQKRPSAIEVVERLNDLNKES